MAFRAFLVMDNTIARQAMAENGGKWWKMDFRGKMVENGFPRVSRHGHRGDQAGISEHRHWAKHIKNFTPSKIRKFFIPLFWPFIRSWHFGADFGKKLELLLSWRGYRGNFRSVDGGTGATLDFRAFPVIPLLLLRAAWLSLELILRPGPGFKAPIHNYYLRDIRSRDG